MCLCEVSGLKNSLLLYIKNMLFDKYGRKYVKSKIYFKTKKISNKLRRLTLNNTKKCSLKTTNNLL